MSKVELQDTPTIPAGETAESINAALWVKHFATGELDLDLDKKATRVYFLRDINPNTHFFHNTREKLKYLVSEGYYKKSFLEAYTWEFLEEFYKSIFDYRYRYQKFIAAEAFYSKVALRDNNTGKYLERFEDRVAATALYLAQGSEEKARRYVSLIMRDVFQPATPTFQNSGRANAGQLTSCAILYVDDSLRSIYRTLDMAAQLSKNGAGVGICFTNIRAKKAAIKGRKGLARGLLGWAQIYEKTSQEVDQLGTRKGAFSISCNALHIDQLDLLHARRAISNRDVNSQLTDIHLCSVIPDILMQKADEGKRVALFCPLDVKRITGKRWTEISIDEWYDRLVADPTVRKEWVDAKKYFDELSFIQSECGEPFVMFEGNVNRASAIPGWVSATNICTEITQKNIIPEWDEKGNTTVVGESVVCNVASLMVCGLMDEGQFGADVATAVDMLTDVVTLSDMSSVPSIVAGNNAARAIGLGTMDFAGFLIREGIVFGDEDSKCFSDVFYETLRYWAEVRSSDLAEQYGSFDGFEETRFADGTAFLWHSTRKRHLTPKVQALIERFNLPVPTNEMWVKQAERTKTVGRYHRYLLAIAPNGGSSYYRAVTPSMNPAPQKIEPRRSGDGKTYYPAAHLTNENQHIYPTAHQVNVYDYLDVYIAAAPHIDQAIAMTLFAPAVWTTRWANAARAYAYNGGLKTIYYVRTDSENERPDAQGSLFSSIKECESCAV